MYNLKQGFEEFMSASGIETKIPEKAKMMLQQAWMAGASCVLKEFAKTYNRSPRESKHMMQMLGKEAYSYDQYKDDITKKINKEIDAQIQEEGHNPVSLGGLFALPYLMGGMGGYGYPGGYYGVGGGFPNMWSHSVRMGTHSDDHDRDMYDHKHKDWHDRHNDARAYGKDYMSKDEKGYVRPMREKYPDVEAYMPMDKGNPMMHGHYANSADYDEHRMQKPMTTRTHVPHDKSLAGTVTPDGKVYSDDGKTYTYQGHIYYADGRMYQ